MIKRELALFLIVGALTVLIDFLTYRGLAWSAPVGTDIAKGCGFVVGTVFAYFANRFWTFAHAAPAPGSAWRFGALYLFTLGANVIVNATVLKLLVDSHAPVQLAFLAATGISASLNFLGMKRFVFTTRGVAEAR
jgi:putative flippase GtrA